MNSAKVLPYFDLHTDALTSLEEPIFESGGDSAQWGLRPFISAGGRVQIFAIYTPPEYDGSDALRYALKFVERLYRYIEGGLPLRLILKAGDLEEIPEGVCGAILSLEGASPLGRNPENLRLFYRLGLRALGLTWNHRNAFADGLGVGDSAGGLTDLGKELLAISEDCGVAIDLSHLHPRGVDDVLERAHKAPFASHANAHALKATSNPPFRNLSDVFIREIGARGGIIGVTFVPEFLHAPTVDAIAEHAKYIARTAGENAVAVGSDFCGCSNPPVPRVSEISRLWTALQQRGVSEHLMRKISSENALSYFRTVLPSS
jgi:membrane dipeptidase